MALKCSEARAQKRNKTKSLIIFKSRGHTGVIIIGTEKKKIVVKCLQPNKGYDLLRGRESEGEKDTTHISWLHIKNNWTFYTMVNYGSSPASSQKW